MALPLSQLVALETEPHLRLLISFFGLFGYKGPLPAHLTDLAFRMPERPTSQNPAIDWENSLAAFCNVFHHRLIALFYRAWEITQKTAALDRPSGSASVVDYFARLVGVFDIPAKSPVQFYFESCITQAGSCRPSGAPRVGQHP